MQNRTAKETSTGTQEKSTGTQIENKPVGPRQESNDQATTAGKRPFTKPVLKKFRQIDYVATYGSE